MLERAGQDSHSHLVVAAGHQLHSFRFDLLSCVPGFLGLHDLSAWTWQLGHLAEVFGQFFDSRRLPSWHPDWPGIVWATPVYVSTCYGAKHLLKAVSKDRIVKQGVGRRGSTPERRRLGFSTGRDEPEIEVDLRRILFDYPFTSCKSRGPVWMRRDRRVTTPDGRYVAGVFEENLGLAGPDDQRFLEAGYYPAHDGLVIRDAIGSIKCIDFAVLILARLEPTQSSYHARVHQLVISYRRDNGYVVDYNTTARDFSAFVGQYVGVEPMLRRFVGWVED